jgi:peroxiredoxin Q/BCP
MCAALLDFGLHDFPGWFRIVLNVKTKTLQIGQPAPVFSLADADMESVGLAAFRGKKNVVLYFYPRDGTPGCTLQAIEFSDHEEEFVRHDCVVLGISPDDCISHAEFRDKHGLSVCLLADPEAEVCEQYGVREVKQCDGVTKTSILRATFVIDKKGRLRHALHGVNPRGHAMEVLQLVKQINRECKSPKTP